MQEASSQTELGQERRCRNLKTRQSIQQSAPTCGEESFVDGTAARAYGTAARQNPFSHAGQAGQPDALTGGLLAAARSWYHFESYDQILRGVMGTTLHYTVVTSVRLRTLTVLVIGIYLQPHHHAKAYNLRKLADLGQFLQSAQRLFVILGDFNMRPDALADIGQHVMIADVAGVFEIS